MLPILFTRRRLITRKALPHERPWTQEYFINGIYVTFAMRKGAFVAKIKRPNCSFRYTHHRRKVPEGISKTKLNCFRHRRDSPDLIPSHFSLFVMLKHRGKDWLLPTIEGHDSDLKRADIRGRSIRFFDCMEDLDSHIENEEITLFISIKR
jgi:hypothetical protein